MAEPIYKTITVKKVVAYCPRCNRVLRKIDPHREPDTFTIMRYHCEHCNWSY